MKLNELLAELSSMQKSFENPDVTFEGVPVVATVYLTEGNEILLNGPVLEDDLSINPDELIPVGPFDDEPSLPVLDIQT